MTVEQEVAQHYTHGSLEAAVLKALAAAGKDIEHLVAADLAPVDEFHTGGRQATIDFAPRLGLRPGMNLLDVGCGLGGASRYFAGEHGCRVAGVDLTEEYVGVAAALSRRVRLDALVSYHCGSALALPFAPATFDGAYMLHVGMNIADKAALFAGVRRVLRAGGVFGIYDVMRENAGDLAFPVPWAATAATSFLADAKTYRRLLKAAGFAIEHERNRREFAIAFFRDMRAKAAAAGGPPPLGIHILMGSTAAEKIGNLQHNLDAGLIAPVEIAARAV